MDKIFQSLFTKELLDSPYRDYNEYILDVLKRVDFLALSYLKYRDDENSFNQIKQKIKDGLQKIDEIIDNRLNKSLNIISFDALQYLKNLYSLKEEEYFIFVAMLSLEIDSKYEEMFKKIDGDKYDLLNVSIKLFYFTKDLFEVENIYENKLGILSKFNALCFKPDFQRLDDRIYSFIISNGRASVDMSGVEVYLPSDSSELLINEDIPNRLYEAVSIASDQFDNLYFYIYGPYGVGKRTIVRRFSDILNASIAMIDLSKVLENSVKSLYNTLIVACREAVINQGCVCIYNYDVIQSEEEDFKGYEEAVISVTKKFSNIIIILSQKPQTNRELVNKYMWVDVQVDIPTKLESIKLWKKGMENLDIEDDLEPFEIANKFSFTPGQIFGTCKEAENLMYWNKSNILTKKDIYDCAYKQVSHNLSKHATLIYSKYNWDQLILTSKEKEMLKNACDQIKYKHIVYDEWGMDKRLAYGRGVSMLFAGPPGTGKTMAAQVVAGELGIEMYKVDLSQIVSKYIGETEKNLSDLFNEAKKSNVILFFDETDALLGKRTEVKDSHDKNANLETSYLLQKMEEYDGITVMSTNYLENIDPAFFRRISYVVHFPFPDIDARKQIWKTMFPKEMPISDDIDFDYLAKQFSISGGNIKNIAVVAAFLAAKSSKKVEMYHIIKAVKYELEKQGKILLREDFGEHWYLLK